MIEYIIQIISILSNIIAAMLGAIIGSFLTYKFKIKGMEKEIEKEMEMRLKYQKKGEIHVNASSISVKQKIEELNDNKIKIYTRFEFILNVRNDKMIKSGVYDFVAKLCYNREYPPIKDGFLSKKEIDISEQFLNIEPFTTKFSSMTIEMEGQIEKRLSPDSYYMYLEYSINGENERKKIMIKEK